MGKCGCSGGTVYGLGAIGSLVYFLQQSTTFVEGLVGLGKAIFWPAFLVYEMFGYVS